MEASISLVGSEGECLSLSFFPLPWHLRGCKWRLWSEEGWEGEMRIPPLRWLGWASITLEALGAPLRRFFGGEWREPCVCSRRSRVRSNLRRRIRWGLCFVFGCAFSIEWPGHVPRFLPHDVAVPSGSTVGSVGVSLLVSEVGEPLRCFSWRMRVRATRATFHWLAVGVHFRMVRYTWSNSASMRIRGPKSRATQTGCFHIFLVQVWSGSSLIAIDETFQGSLEAFCLSQRRISTHMLWVVVRHALPLGLFRRPR